MTEFAKPVQSKSFLKTVSRKLRKVTNKDSDTIALLALDLTLLAVISVLAFTFI